MTDKTAVLNQIRESEVWTQSLLPVLEEMLDDIHRRMEKAENVQAMAGCQGAALVLRQLIGDPAREKQRAQLAARHKANAKDKDTDERRRDFWANLRRWRERLHAR